MDVQKLRKDFPILRKKFEGKPIIYLDSACMTLKPKQVIEAMDDYYFNFPACSGRSIHRLSTRLTLECEEARERIRGFLNAERTEEIIITKNATEGLNIVAKGFVLEKGDIVLTTDREHNSNLVPWHELQNLRGIKHYVIPSNQDNTFNIENLKKKMNRKVRLVSMVHTANFDGYTIPAKEIIEIAHDFGAKVMLDGAQSIPSQKVDVNELDTDFFTFSVHKLCGPTGVGVLYGKYELLEKTSPLITGGDTVENTTYSSSKLLKPPQKFEAGLQNYAGIIGAKAAVEYVSRLGMNEIASHERKLNRIVTNSLKNERRLSIIGPKSHELRGGIFGFNIEGLNSHDIAMILDEENIMIRSGMQCAHSWFNARGINGSARASFYIYNTEEEAKTLIRSIKKIIKSTD